jgi:hypothetical protein
MKNRTIALLGLSLVFAANSFANPVIGKPTVEESSLVKFGGKSFTPARIGWTWDQNHAWKYCQALTVGGKAVFRLPTQAELAPFLRAGKLTVAYTVPGSTAGAFWTSSQEDTQSRKYFRCSSSGSCALEWGSEEKGGEQICVRDNGPVAKNDKTDGKVASKNAGSSGRAVTPALTLTQVEGDTNKRIAKQEAEKKANAAQHEIGVQKANKELADEQAAARAAAKARAANSTCVSSGPGSCNKSK